MNEREENERATGIDHHAPKRGREPHPNSITIQLVAGVALTVFLAVYVIFVFVPDLVMP